MPAETMHEPTVSATPRDERNEAAKLEEKFKKAQKEYERAQFDASQKEAFGKYDVTAPNEGEETYQSYLDKRPAGPTGELTRTGQVPQNAETGKIASQAAYQEQLGDATRYYNEKAGLHDAEAHDPGYDVMGVAQLAKEVINARALGDPAAEADIRKALEHHLTMDAMKDDSESPAEAQARYEGEVARFEELVVKFANMAPTEPNVFGPGAEARGAAAAAEAGANDTEAGAGEANPAGANETEPATKDPEVTLNGEKVSVGDVFVSPDGQRVVEVVAEDGTKKLVYENALAFADSAAADASDKGAAATAEGAEKSDTAPAGANAGEKDAGDKKDAAGKEKDEEDKTEPYEGPAFPVDSKGVVEVLDDDLKEQIKDIEADPRVEEERLAAEAAAEKEKKLTERVKNWFQKEGKKFQEFGGKAYMAGLFEAGARGVKTGVNRMLEWRVKEDMTPEEKDKIRKQNRYGAIAFGAAAAALTIGLLAANGMNSDGGGAEVPTPTPTETVDPGLQDILNPGGAAGGEITPDVPATPEVVVPNEAFNIPSGGGGEALFGDLKIDTTKWYDNEDALLANFPNELYRMDSGHVGISRPGLLSQGLQDAINALK